MKQPEEKTPSKKMYSVIFIFGIGLLLIPIAIYLNTFGSTLSTEHEHWSEFGTILAGIYTPILTFGMIFVIGFQAYLQKTMRDHQILMSERQFMMDAQHYKHEALMSKQQMDMNKYYRDQDFFNVNTEDFNFYLERLSHLLKTSNLSKSISDCFLDATKEQLRNEDFVKNNPIVSNELSQIYSYWLAIQVVLDAFTTIDEAAYRVRLKQLINKCVVVLSGNMCVSLDKVCFTLSHKKSTEDCFFWEE